MYDIAWVTCNKIPDLIDSERRLLSSLHVDHLHVKPVVWDDSRVDWEEFKLVLIRSVWDYHLKIDQFLNWLDKLDDLRVMVYNPIHILRWNHHKFYLNDLKLMGVPVLPTMFHRKNETLDLQSIFAKSGWKEIIIKPAISATAYKLYRLTPDISPHMAKELMHLAKNCDLLIQKFQPAIITSGEWSFIFLNKKFSHSVHKMPAPGDFRTQNDFGGTIRLRPPEDSILKQVKQIMQSIDQDLLYSRIDGIIINGQFQLMELELIEPDLFLMDIQLRNNFKTALRTKI
ncbi:MAG: hypothetical protein O2887_00140 [Bacteroidetes bacterium]|nr:hypothetical protein [Bacteroidota bacterium]MDA1118898.1 hypothetical protein [Bacteroidota bacterium]